MSSTIIRGTVYLLPSTKPARLIGGTTSRAAGGRGDCSLLASLATGRRAFTGETAKLPTTSGPNAPQLVILYTFLRGASSISRRGSGWLASQSNFFLPVPSMSWSCPSPLGGSVGDMETAHITTPSLPPANTTSRPSEESSNRPSIITMQSDRHGRHRSR